MHRVLILLVLLLAGCNGTPLASQPTEMLLDAPLSASPAVVTPTPFQPMAPGVTDAVGIQPLPTDGQPAAPQPLQSLESSPDGSDWQVTLLSDMEVETSESTFRLQGMAPAGTVLTVNEQILVVDASAAFVVEVTLEEGPNLLEVLASSAAGEEAEFLLTVYYNP